MQARMQRQQILYEPGRRFRFVVTEAALRYKLASRDVMAGQLDRLVSAAASTNIRLGVIPFGVGLPVAPSHGFWIFDDRTVLVETVAAELRLQQDEEVRLYTDVFERLAAVARYGTQARAIITEVIDDLGAI